MREVGKEMALEFFNGADEYEQANGHEEEEEQQQDSMDVDQDHISGIGPIRASAANTTTGQDNDDEPMSAEV